MADERVSSQPGAIGTRLLGGLDLFSLFGIDDDLAEKAREALEERAKEESKSLIREFDKRLAELEQRFEAGDRTSGERRRDARVMGLMRQEGKILFPPCMHGNIPGIEPGLLLHGKPRFKILGIHDKHAAGISCANETHEDFKKGAYSIAVGNTYNNEQSVDRETLYYSGQDTGNKSYADQDPNKKENLALWNNKVSGTPLRVIKKVNDSYDWKYLGLYDVVERKFEDEDLCEKQLQDWAKHASKGRNQSQPIPKKRKVITFVLRRNEENKYKNTTAELPYDPSTRWLPGKSPLSRMLSRQTKRKPHVLSQPKPCTAPDPAKRPRAVDASAESMPIQHIRTGSSDVSLDTQTAAAMVLADLSSSPSQPGSPISDVEAGDLDPEVQIISSSGHAANTDPSQLPKTPSLPPELAAQAALQEEAAARFAARQSKATVQVGRDPEAAHADPARHCGLPPGLAKQAAAQEAHAARFAARQSTATSQVDRGAKAAPARLSALPPELAQQAAEQEAAAAQFATQQRLANAQASAQAYLNHEAVPAGPAMTPSLPRKLAEQAAVQEAAAAQFAAQQSTTIMSAEPADLATVDKGVAACNPKQLLCDDISGGKESVKIPVINTVDKDQLPYFEYITQCTLSNDAASSVDKAASSVDKLYMPFIDKSQLFMSPEEAFLKKTLGTKKPALKIAAMTKFINEAEDPIGEKVISKGVQMPLEVFKTTDKGWGLRCRKPIPKHTFICEYIGEVVTKDEAENCQDGMYHFSLDSFKSIAQDSIEKQEDLMGEPIDPQTKSDIEKRCQAFRDTLVIDSLRRANVARFINHASDGNNMNCAACPAIVQGNHSTLFFSICIFSLKDIDPGEELYYDYGLNCTNSDLSTMPSWYQKEMMELQSNLSGDENHHNADSSRSTSEISDRS